MDFDPPFTVVLLATLAASGLGLLVAGVGIALFRTTTPQVSVGAVALGAVVAFALATAVVPEAALPTSVIGAVALLTPAVRRGAGRGGRQRGGATAVGGVALTGLSVAGLLIGAYVPQYEPTEMQQARGAMPVVVEADDHSAYSDHGRTVRLLAPMDPKTSEQLVWLEDQVLGDALRRGRIVRTGPADVRSNCHGWVFTGGRFWLYDEELHQVLEENGYRTTVEPAVGDVVAYRDENGLICHTAVVRAVGDDCTIMVEGKWGWMGVFLHRVDVSRFGQDYSFFRADRRGHVLAGLEPVAVAAEPVVEAEAELCE